MAIGLSQRKASCTKQTNSCAKSFFKKSFCLITERACTKLSPCNVLSFNTGSRSTDIIVLVWQDS